MKRGREGDVKETAGSLHSNENRDAILSFIPKVCRGRDGGWYTLTPMYANGIDVLHKGPRLHRSMVREINEMDERLLTGRKGKGSVDCYGAAD